MSSSCSLLVILLGSFILQNNPSIFKLNTCNLYILIKLYRIIITNVITAIFTISLNDCERRQCIQRYSIISNFWVRLLVFVLLTLPQLFKGWATLSTEKRRLYSVLAQTFFTNQDLHYNNFTPSRSGSSTLAPNKTNQQFRKEWNYSGKCSCALSDASYKAVHRYCVCDSSDHVMLMCPKRRYLIRSAPSSAS